MKLLLTFSAIMAVALCNTPPSNFQQSQNFNSEQFQTNQFQSQSYQQQAQQQQIKLNPSSNLGQSNQYLPPPQNNPGFNNNRNNPGFNNNRNQPAVFNNQNNPSFNNPNNPINRGPGSPGGFQQNQAQSININGNQFQGNQAQQAYGNKLESHQNQHQNQQANFPSGLGNSKFPNSNQNFQNRNKNQNVYHSESHRAASASSSSKYEHQQGFKAHSSSMKHHSSQYNRDEDIIRNEASPDGSYAYSYDTSDGTSVEQSGYIKNPGARSEDKILSVKGSYSYIAPEGDRISVSYVADENGYRATSIKS